MNVTINAFYFLNIIYLCNVLFFIMKDSIDDDCKIIYLFIAQISKCKSNYIKFIHQIKNEKKKNN